MARSQEIQNDTRTTVQRKTDAIQGMHARVNAMGGDNWTVELIAAEIRGIAGTIRSQAWRNAVESYALFVEDNASHLDWAYAQGSVYFAYEVL